IPQAAQRLGGGLSNEGVGFGAVQERTQHRESAWVLLGASHFQQAHRQWNPCTVRQRSDFSVVIRQQRQRRQQPVLADGAEVTADGGAVFVGGGGCRGACNHALQRQVRGTMDL